MTAHVTKNTANNTMYGVQEPHTLSAFNGINLNKLLFEYQD